MTTLGNLLAFSPELWLLLGAITFANFYLLTLYVQQVLGYSAIKTGITFVVTAGSAVLWAGLAQSLTTRR